MHELPKINNVKSELETEIKSVELNEPLVAQEEVKALNEESVNVKLLTKIFMLWMATVPIAMGSSFVLTWVFLRM
jgi:phosphate/sulfate permease